MFSFQAVYMLYSFDSITRRFEVDKLSISRCLCLPKKEDRRIFTGRLPAYSTVLNE